MEMLADMSPEARAAMGQRGREWILQRRDYRVLARQFLDGLTHAPAGAP